MGQTSARYSVGKGLKANLLKACYIQWKYQHTCRSTTSPQMPRRPPSHTDHTLAAASTGQESRLQPGPCSLTFHGAALWWVKPGQALPPCLGTRGDLPCLCHLSCPSPLPCFLRLVPLPLPRWSHLLGPPPWHTQAWSCLGSNPGGHGSPTKEAFEKYFSTKVCPTVWLCAGAE